MVYNGFTLNYSYDIGIGGLNRKAGGAHEISLGYRFKFSGNKYFDKKVRTEKRGKAKQYRELPFPQVQEYNYRKR
jgi:hypothetical protein